MNEYLKQLGTDKGRRVVQSLTGTAIGIEILLSLYPINTGALRVAFLLLIPLILVGMTIVLWKNKILRCGPLVFAVAIAAAFLAPGRDIPKDRLQLRYISSLRFYEGVRYVWGGENLLGIDCSGLVRKAMISANFKEGLFRLNSAALRQAFALWLHDCSARNLSEGYNGRTSVIGAAKNLNSLDSSKLQPGTMAITKDGVHVLVYLGSGEWLEADPGLKKVVAIHPPANNPWFEAPVVLALWNQLAL